MALVCLAAVPVFAITNYVQQKFARGMIDEQHELMKEADLLCGDAILNYKTVQSFGHEELLVQKYTEWVDPVRSKSVAGNVK